MASLSDDRAARDVSLTEMELAPSLLVKIWYYPTLQPNSWPAAFLFPHATDVGLPEWPTIIFTNCFQGAIPA
jgi:hypothetical protein